jgi:hypothetical protein
MQQLIEMFYEHIRKRLDSSIGKGWPWNHPGNPVGISNVQYHRNLQCANAYVPDLMKKTVKIHPKKSVKSEFF